MNLQQPLDLAPGFGDAVHRDLSGEGGDDGRYETGKPFGTDSPASL